jgi:hypothetical protein
VLNIQTLISTADYENALPVQDIEEANGISSEDLGKIELLSLM